MTLLTLDELTYCTEEEAERLITMLVNTACDTTTPEAALLSTEAAMNCLELFGETDGNS